MSGLSFAHHGRAPSLRDVSLNVDPGETLVLEGASGAGKSTLLRIACGLVPRVQGGRFTGRVRVGGEDPAHLAPSQLARRVGFVPQDPETSFVARTLEAELVAVLANVGARAREARLVVEETLAEFDLQHLAHRELATLSGGEAARASLAAALVARPGLVVLDEPDAQLDPTQRLALRGTLRALTAGGLAVLVAAHPPHPFDGPRTRTRRMPGDETSAPTTLPSARPGRVLLEADGVAFAHGEDHVLGPVDLALRAGEVVALTGPNGSGKTTLLHLLAGLLKPREGRVRLDGEDPRALPAGSLAARVGVAFQHPAWHITQDTVAEELALTARALGRSLDLAGTLERFDIAALARAHPWDLSGGERQRLAVATAAAHEPDVLLLDEPTRGMDARSRARIAELFAERTRAGRATLVATHHAELAGLAHRVVRLERGVLHEDARPPMAVAP